MPSSAVAKIRKEEREKGRKDQLTKLDEEARNLGFKNYAEMRAAAERSRSYDGGDDDDVDDRPKTTRTRTRSQDDDTDEDDQPKRRSRRLKKREEEVERLKQERRRLNKARARSDRRAKQLQRELDAREAEHSMRLAAARAGVTEVDYAIHVLRKELRSKSEEDLAKFDESKFFRETLKRTHPFLYDPKQEPATTGNPSDGAPPPPDASEGKKKTGDSKEFDARSVERPDFLKRLKEHGFQDPSTQF